MAKQKKTITHSTSSSASMHPPVVVVLGHVDHGKTTLLDYIRKTHQANQEPGGITQAIGAYQVEVETKDSKRLITFIDTPGHQAFAAMRSRGAAIADIAILVVAADDGVMPQTIEAIHHIQQAQIPMIVAVNKSDVAPKMIDRIKQQLAKAEVLVEGYGGSVVAIPISAKTGLGVQDLLEMILLVNDLRDTPKTSNPDFSAVVIESKRDRRIGVVATLIIKNGSLRIGDQIATESVGGKVRQLISDAGKPVKEATIGQPVEVLGFNDIPQVGAIVYGREMPKKGQKPTQTVHHEKSEEKGLLKIVIKADGIGSLEALRTIFPPSAVLVSEGIGDITESDVLYAKTTDSIIVGYNVRISSAAKKLAELERVLIKIDNIIYTLADEIQEVIAALEQGGLEEFLGEGTIVAEFMFNKDRIAGVRVTKERLARGDTVKLMRENQEIGRNRIKSIRQGKLEVTRVEAGNECGIAFTSPLDFAIGDAIIAYRK